MWKVVAIITDATGANVADVNASGALKVTGSFTPGPVAPLTASAPAVATVGATSAQAVASNTNRLGLILVNVSTSDQVISLGFGGNAAVLNEGVTLRVGDGYNMGQYDFTTGQVNAIASAVAAALTVQEYT